MRTNPYFSDLPNDYLFAAVENRLRAYLAKHPSAALIKMGIGDVTQPLASVVTEAGQRAVAEMGNKEPFICIGYSRVRRRPGNFTVGSINSKLEYLITRHIYIIMGKRN